MTNLNEFRAAIKAAHAATATKWREQILAADRATGRTGALKGHARWNLDVARGRGIRARVAAGFAADLAAALAPIRAAWGSLPTVEVSTRDGIGTSSIWEVRKVLPDGSTARRDALHWEWRAGVWPMQALGR